MRIDVFFKRNPNGEDDAVPGLSSRFLSCCKVDRMGGCVQRGQEKLRSSCTRGWTVAFMGPVCLHRCNTALLAKHPSLSSKC